PTGRSTGWPRRCGPRTMAARCGWPGNSTSAACGSTPTSRWWPRCRTAGSSTPATARTCPCTGSRTTPGGAMGNGITWYDVLEVQPGASPDEIQYAYDSKTSLLQPEIVAGAPA